MHSLLAIAGFCVPGLMVGLVWPSQSRDLSQLLGRSVAFSILGYLVVGYVLIRLGIFTPLWDYSIVAFLSVVVVGLNWRVARDSILNIRRDAVWNMLALVPFGLLLAVRWFVYERRDSYPLGWDAGVNFSYMTYLENFGEFPSFRLAEPLANGYQQGTFVPATILNSVSANPSFTDFKLFHLVAIGLLLVGVTQVVRRHILSDRDTVVSELAITVASVVVFSSFLVNSAHLALILGLGVGFFLLSEVGEWRRLTFGRLGFLLLGGFVLIAIHPPSAQVFGIAVVFWGAAHAGKSFLRGSAIAAIGVGVLVSGVAIHYLLAPQLTSSAVQYAAQQVEIIDEGISGINALGVESGNVRQSLSELLVWLLPPTAAGFATIGFIALLLRRRWTSAALFLAFAIVTLVKLLPTNGREYLLLLFPLTMITATGVRELTSRLTMIQSADLAISLVLVLVMLASGMTRALDIARDPEVGPFSYVDDRAGSLAAALDTRVPADSVIAARYSPAVAFVEAETGLRMLGGLSAFGGAHRTIDRAIAAGPTPETMTALCRYDASWVLLHPTDKAFDTWRDSSLARYQIDSHSIFELDCRNL